MSRYNIRYIKLHSSRREVFVASSSGIALLMHDVEDSASQLETTVSSRLHDETQYQTE